MRAHFSARTLACLLLMTVANMTFAADLGIPDLMQMLGQRKTGTATFIEKKYIAMLDQPLESSGELAFSAPDHLEKRTLKPKPESVVLDGNKLVLERADGRRMTVSLTDRPEVAAFVESIRATLTGDRTALEHYYTTGIRGSAEQWQLTLTPVQSRMLKVIRQIRIAGQHDQVKSIEFMQADGDHSIMDITSTTSK
jgi:outer membrane lipoprotein-sorting protein